jgi:hypothetical protein
LFGRIAPPLARDPHGEVQSGRRIDPAQHGPAIEAAQLGPEFLCTLSSKRGFGVLTGPDMTAREVPHTWIPPPLRRAVAQQNLVSPTQDHRNYMVILHRSSMTSAGQGCRALH